MKEYRSTSSALTELSEATRHYEDKENGLGGILLDEVDATVARILANPNAWHPLSPRVRRCRTHRFPFGLLDQIRSNEILIVAVMDLRRDPKSWKYLLRS
jgi:hypothetical protein